MLPWIEASHEQAGRLLRIENFMVRRSSFDCTDACCEAPETELIGVDAPPECNARLEERGRDPHIVWRVKLRETSSWIWEEHVAAILCKLEFAEVPGSTAVPLEPETAHWCGAAPTDVVKASSIRDFVACPGEVYFRGW